MSDDQLIGGGYCHAELGPGLLPVEGQVLGKQAMDSLWALFAAIGRYWQMSDNLSGLRSKWLDFVRAKADHQPSYIAEFNSACGVLEELVQIHGEEPAYTLLLLKSGVPEGPPLTRLAHAKRYVVDEFIRVYVASGGFRSFGALNYKGYLGGSRYNGTAPVRSFQPEEEG